MDQYNLSQPFLTLCGAVVAALALRFLVVTLKRPKYLPGPRGVPFFGNLFQIPTANSWELYAKWRNTYGDAIYVTAMGNPIVVLNSYQACVDLLEKRSDVYSDRPVSIMAGELMGWRQAATLVPYNDRWRRFRRITAQAMRKGAVQQYWPGQEREIRRFLGSLITEPEKFIANFRFAAGRDLLASVYGVDVQTAEDPIITAAERAMDIATYATAPGTFLVDFFPIFRHIPSWVPGATFKKFAEKGRAFATEMVNLPFDQTKADMKSGRYVPSFTSVNLEGGEDEDIVRWCSGTMYAGSFFTQPYLLYTIATIHAFLMAMVLNQDIQKRAQAEIDAHIGTGRLPTIADRNDLPYVNAIVKEVMRWQPVAPIALPHRSTRDDVYKGCFIPAGSTVLGNTWAITRDPTLYPDPERFNPDRFLPLFDKSIKSATPPFDPIAFTFGFGRRICSGMHYADTMTFLSMASILATFDMRPAKDDAGRDILPELKFISSVVREVVPFKYSIAPRAHAASVIAAAQMDL
ncbi:cytochrome P450 [Infundibulicybe gibba]|nr:cytochrome P450 [Infundibulicybe gibba]